MDMDVAPTPATVDSLGLDRRLARWLVLANLVMLAFLAGLATLALQGSYRTHAQRAQATSENLATTLQQTIASELAQVDLALLNVRASLRRSGQTSESTDPVVEAVLADQMRVLPVLDSLRIADASGLVRHGPGVAGAPVNMSNRLVFQRARDEASDSLQVSEPLQARISRKWVIAVVRRLERPDGSFDGVVYATLAVDHFQQILGAMDLGPQDAVTLRSTSLQLIARHSPLAAAQPVPVGNAVVSAELAAAVRANPTSGSFMSVTPMDKVERLTAYRQVKPYPLMVLVGLGTEDFFSPWHEQRAQLLGLLLALTLAMAGGSVIALRSARRQTAASRALLAEARRSETLLRVACDGIHVLDRSGALVRCSDSFATMLDQAPRAMPGRNVRSWEAVMTDTELAERLRGIQVGETQRFETRHRRRDGSLIEVEVQSRAAEIDGRELIYCAARDITERKQMQAELAESAQRIRDLYDQAPCGYHSLDANGVFVHVNATSAAWLGLPASELIGRRRITDFFTDEGRDAFALNFPLLQATGRVQDLEFDLVSASGARRRVQISATAIYDDQGRFLMSRSVVHDITPLQEAQALRLAAVQLQAENRNLQESSRVQQAFLNNLSHELRTPLNAVLGLSRLLRSGTVAPGSPKHEEFLDLIGRSGKQLLSLIDTILQYSRAEAGKLPLLPERTELTGLVAELQAVFEEQLQARQQVLQVSIAPAVQSVMLDPLRLKQVLATYLANAIKFSPDQGVLQLRAQRDGDRGLRIEVEDHGIGIAGSDLSRIFMPFRQLSEGTAKRYAGVGIGLALARRIIESQGGSVGVRSREGQGSVFHLVLPDVV